MPYTLATRTSPFNPRHPTPFATWLSCLLMYSCFSSSRHHEQRIYLASFAWPRRPVALDPYGAEDTVHLSREGLLSGKGHVVRFFCRFSPIPLFNSVGKCIDTTSTDGSPFLSRSQNYRHNVVVIIICQTSPPQTVLMLSPRHDQYSMPTTTTTTSHLPHLIVASTSITPWPTRTYFT